MRFNVGDKVIIKEDLKVGGSYEGGWGFTPVMTQYLGKETTITSVEEVYNQNIYKLDIDKQAYCWTDSMLRDLYLWKFNLEEFKNKNIAINCETEEDLVSMIKVVEENNITFIKEHYTTKSFGNTFTIMYNKPCEMLNYGSVMFFQQEEYTIYKFKEIKFQSSKVEDVEQRITSMTLEQLYARGFKTGDIVFTEDAKVGIVYGIDVAYISKIGWDKTTNEEFKVIKLIPVEFLTALENRWDIYDISELFNTKTINSEIEKYIIKIEQPAPKKTVKVYQVEFTPKGKLYDFISNQDDIIVGNIVECNTKSGSRKYAKTRGVEYRQLTAKEISSEYRYCRAVSN